MRVVAAAPGRSARASWETSSAALGAARANSSARELEPPTLVQLSQL